MPNAQEFQPKACYPTATITVGGTTSGEVDLHGCELCGVFLPPTFDGTTLTITASPTSGGTFVTVENGAASPANVTLTGSAASKYVPLAAADRDAVRGLRFIKLVTGSTQTTTDTILTLAVKPA
jgi:hypothetical protein